MTGRTHHILIDTIGLLLTVYVHAAAVQDPDGAKLLRAGPGARFPRLAIVGVDGAYQGPCASRITETLDLPGPDCHGSVSHPPIGETPYTWNNRLPVE